MGMHLTSTFWHLFDVDKKLIHKTDTVEKKDPIQ